MMLTFFTVLAGAALGGGVAIDITVVVVLAGIALAVIAVANGARLVRRVGELYDE